MYIHLARFPKESLWATMIQSRRPSIKNVLSLNDKAYILHLFLVRKDDGYHIPVDIFFDKIVIIEIKNEFCAMDHSMEISQILAGKVVPGSYTDKFSNG